MIYLIWCEDSNKGIGLKNSIPWDIVEDRIFFKQTTLNHPIVMGRKTFESLNKKPLPNRTNIVLTKNHDYKTENNEVLIFNDINTILNKFKNEDIYIIGGKQIYKEFWNYADYLIISKLNESYNCDIFMDDLNYSKFNLIKKDVKKEFKIYYYVNKNLKKEA